MSDESAVQGRRRSWLAERDRWAALEELDRHDYLASTPAQRAETLAGLMSDGERWEWIAACRRAETDRLSPPPEPPRVREGLVRDPGPAVRSLQAWADAVGLEMAFVGGVAAALLAKPRFTKDVDALAVPLDDARLAAAIDRLPAFGLELRPDWSLDLVFRRGLLFLEHPVARLRVDVLLAISPLHAGVVRDAATIDAFDTRIRVPRVEDLFIMKALALRPLDRIDMQHLLDLRAPEIDLAKVRGIVAEAAAAMATPDLLEDFDRFVHDYSRYAARRSRGRPPERP